MKLTPTTPVFPSVGADGKIRESHLPDRLSESSLTNKIMSIGGGSLIEDPDNPGLFIIQAGSNLTPELLTMPSGFADVPFSLHRQLDGEITHDFDFAPYQDAPTHIYFDGSSGARGGDGSEESPFARWADTVDAAGASGDVVIHVVSPFADRLQTVATNGLVVDGKRVSIIGEGTDRAWITGASEGHDWTQDDTVWYTSRSVVRAVFSSEVDEHGIPVPLHSAATLEECRDTPDSWWSDGSLVYVNSPVAPTNLTHRVMILVAAFGDTTIRNGGELYIENIGLLQPGETKFNGDGTGRLIFNNCALVGGDLRPQATGSYGNGLNLVDVKTTMSFSTIAAHNARDGFNYHYSGTPERDRRDCLAFEYNCLAYNLGSHNTEGNNNATSAHEGISVLRVGTVGRDMSGPALADVGGCLSVNYDCHMTGGVRNYLFEGGEAWLHDCRSIGPVYDHLYLTQDAVVHGEPIPT